MISYLSFSTRQHFSINYCLPVCRVSFRLSIVKLDIIEVRRLRSAVFTISQSVTKYPEGVIWSWHLQSKHGTPKFVPAVETFLNNVMHDLTLSHQLYYTHSYIKLYGRTFNHDCLVFLTCVWRISKLSILHHGLSMVQAISRVCNTLFCFSSLVRSQLWYYLDFMILGAKLNSCQQSLRLLLL